MRTLVSALLALSISSPAALAHAGGYLSLGVGSDATLAGEMGTRFTTQDLSVGRLGAGYRVGSLALEATLMGTGLRDASIMTQTPSEGGDSAVLTAGVDIKYYFGIAGSFEGYLKGGLHKTWVKPQADASGSPMNDLHYAGRGYGLGAGVQYSLRVLPMVNAAVWLDLDRRYLDLESETDASTLAGTADTLTLGVSIGL